MCSKIWIGLVHAKPMNKKGEKLIEGQIGLYTNLLAMVENRNQFSEKARIFFKKEGLRLEEVEDEEPFENRIKNGSSDAQCHEVAEYVKNTGETETTDWQLYENDE
jgi:hypothetical protein